MKSSIGSFWQVCRLLSRKSMVQPKHRLQDLREPKQESILVAKIYQYASTHLQNNIDNRIYNYTTARYVAHIARRSNLDKSKQLLFNVDRSTKKGRPTETLEQKVLKELNMTADEFYKQALKGTL
ncbi:hypothetical protein AC249_AIPGENE16591 [Exaiptasia diaphana]|nr:hypothetical protein AC249_AIPGENE16591 [Exaiptasia diaphana]